MKKNELLAICLKTYPDENDMRAFCEGELSLSDIKIYYEGKEYFVNKGFDKEYYKLKDSE